MFYVLDPDANPGLVVVATEFLDRAIDVAARYAVEVAPRQVVIAEAPSVPSGVEVSPQLSLISEFTTPK